MEPQQSPSRPTIPRPVRLGFALILAAIAFWFFLAPACTSGRYAFTDPGLSDPSQPLQFAVRNHRQITDRYADYCEKRIASGVAETLDRWEIAATEWPLFGSGFYLWATLSLQEAYESDPDLFGGADDPENEPRVYARRAINAATALIVDPGHAHWVREHWGESEYLRRENCFYRMLLIAALTSHRQLTGGNDEYLAILIEQIESLSAELVAAPTGLIDDYPRQCYPGDVVAAIREIHRANILLGRDDAAFLQTMRERLFRPAQVAENGLLPYAADSKSGTPYDPSRGCSNSYATDLSAEIWPSDARLWYQAYTDDFWNANWLVAGFREFPNGMGPSSYFDVDAGPVVGGLGAAATTFGLAAARANDATGHAQVLGAQSIVASWPLPDGTLLLPYLVSDRKHAPHLGRVAMLYQMTRLAVADAGVGKARVRRPACVYLGILFQVVVGVMLVRWAIRIAFPKKKTPDHRAS